MTPTPRSPRSIRPRLIGSLCLIGFMLLAHLRSTASNDPNFAPGTTPNTSSNEQSLSLITLSGRAMTIDYHITFGMPLDPQQIKDAEQTILATFLTIHEICNQWNPDSLISQCNQMSAGERKAIPPLLETLLLTAHQVHTLSRGRYDLTIEPLKALWMNSLQKGEEPSAALLAQIAPHIGWHQLHIEKGWLWKDHDKLSLNLDSIAKGLCVDLLTENLVAAGFPDLLVEWGGEIRAAGEHPDGRPWQLFIRRLEDADPAHALATVALSNAALATSGDYLQHWDLSLPKREKLEQAGEAGEAEKITYFHILDPNTLRPLSMRPGSIASVTVRAPTCALADALATAGMFCADLDEAQQWARAVQEQFPDTAFWFAARAPARILERKRF